MGKLKLKSKHRLLCGDSTSEADVARLMDGKKINVAVTSPPYASQRKYDEISGFKPIHPDKYVEWFDGVQKQVAEHLADDGSWFVNIKEHCKEGQRVLYVKDLTLAHVREWGWRFVDEYIWTHGGTPKVPQARFKNGWEPIFQFTKGPHKFRPESVLHETAQPGANGGGIDWHGYQPSNEASQGKKNRTTRSKDGRKSGSLADTQGTPNQVGGYTSSDQLAYPSNVLSLGKNQEALGHPAAYPVKLPEFFIKAYSDEGDLQGPIDTAYDPFLGSGTTMIACEKLNRKCYGMEISPLYCDVAVKRWENLTGEKAVRLSDMHQQATSPR